MLSTASFAQDAPAAEAEAPKTVFGGNLDTYYKFDASRRVDQGLTSFTSGTHNSFELGMASINAAHEFGKAKVYVDLGFGKRAEEFTYAAAGTNSTILIKEAYLSYQAMEGLEVTMGSFATHVGYELLNAVDNRNYSMSYAFSYGPFLNTGIKANYTKDSFNFMLGVSNPTDFRSAMVAGSTQKTIISQVGYSTDDTGIYLNYTGGSTNPNLDNTHQVDLVVTQKLDEEFSAGLNATYKSATKDGVSKSANWFSTVGYLNYDYSDKLGLTYRAEYFGDKDGLATFGSVGGANVFANTLSFNIKEGNLVIIPEIRIDSASEKVFIFDDKPSKMNAYFILATAYRF